MTPLSAIAEALLLILDAISVFVILFLFYTAFLIRRDRRLSELPQPDHFAAWHGLAFLGLIILSLALAHQRAWSGDVWHVPAVLVGSLLICGVYYFWKVREHWKDDRVRYAMLLATAFWILICLLLGFIYWVSRKGGGFELEYVNGETLAQYVNSLAQIGGIIIAATMVVVTNRQNARKADETARQRIYQTLELESISLFQFECEHPEIVARLWFSKLPEVEGQRELHKFLKDYQLKQYTCQILNLFEMACRFHKQRIFDADVFGSWVIWMWELCCEEEFQNQWCGEEGIEYNYVETFREIINAGIYFAKATPNQIIANSLSSEAPRVSFSDRRYSFFQFVGHVMNDEDHVERWLGRTTVDLTKFARFWSIKNRADTAHAIGSTRADDHAPA